jgi:hypothetical protein
MQSLAQDMGFARTFRPRMPANASQAREIIARGVAARFIAWARKQAIETVVAEKFGGNPLVLRAAVNPAMTNVSGWASELVSDAIGPFMALAPSSAYAQLAARSPRVSFTQNAVISIPSDTYSPDVAASMFVLEGNPIPVVSFAFDGTPLQPRKAAAIVTWTREMAKATPFTISTVFAQMLENYVGYAADLALLGANPASPTSPGGIGYDAVAVAEATTGAPADRILADLRNLAQAVADSGPLVNPVYIMSTANKIAVDAVYPGLDVIGSPMLSTGAGAHTVYCIDAASFVSGEGDQADVDFGEEATLHMETVPLQIATGGTAASPTRSLFQTASVGARVISSLDWVVRGTGRVATLQEAWFETP